MFFLLYKVSWKKGRHQHKRKKQTNLHYTKKFQQNAKVFPENLIPYTLILLAKQTHAQTSTDRDETPSNPRSKGWKQLEELTNLTSGRLGEGNLEKNMKSIHGTNGMVTDIHEWLDFYGWNMERRDS